MVWFCFEILALCFQIKCWEDLAFWSLNSLGACITSFIFQMYIALISLHALIMVGFHFLYCFEEDWTSEYKQNTLLK